MATDTPLRVIELRGSTAGAVAAKLLADLGAEVVVVADPERSLAPGAGIGLPLYLDIDKGHHRVPAGSSADGWAGIDGPARELLAGADIIIDSSAPDPLVPFRSGPAGADLDGRTVVVEISPFGADGPRSTESSTELTDQAASGHLLLTGDPDREPLQGPAHQVAWAVGLHAAIGAMAAVAADREAPPGHTPPTGRGQRVEITHFEVLTALHQFTLLRWTHAGDVLRRMGNRYAGPGRPIGAYRCRDAMISLVVPRDDQLDRLLGVAGLDHLTELPGIESTYDLMHHPTLLDEHLVPWLATQDAAETVDLLQVLRVPAGPVNQLADVLADEQLTAREAWRQVDHDGTAVRIPRSPIRITPPLAAATPPADEGHEGDDGPARRPLGGTDGPLGGLRVLDLTRVWAGPLATRILADLGADVIMVEAPWARGPAGIDRSSVEATRYYPDNDPGPRHWNRIGFVNKYAINKRSIALDLSSDGGRDALAAMVASVDVVIENYSPRVMPQLGLDEASLHRLNPDLVYVTMPGFGRSGPATDRVAYGPMIDSQAGLSALMGYPDEPARKGGIAWPDPIAGMVAALATIAAVRRGRDGAGGATVEVAQYEATVATIGHALVDRQLQGTEPARPGNRHPGYAPHGVYRARGDDRWVALTVVDDGRWRTLVDLAGLDPAWAKWSTADRLRHHDEIDDAVGAWIADRAADEAADTLQAGGIAAAATAEAPDVMTDPHHDRRGFFVTLDHPEAGRHAWPGLAIRFDATPATYRRPAPLLNEHGDEVLAELAHRTPTEIADLRLDGAMTDTPPD